MLLFQTLVFLFVIGYGKNKSWTKYLLIANACGWYIWLQKSLQKPGAVGVLLPELIVILITDIFYIWMRRRQKKAETLKKENALLQEQINRYQSQIEQNECHQKRVCQIRHDLKNQLWGLNGLLIKGEYEEARRIIDDTLGELCASNCVQTGNVMLDSLINGKIACAKEKGIPVEVEVRIPAEDRFDSMPLVIAVGNLLDNAIEACENVSKDKRYIKIKIIQRDSRVFAEIENSFSGEIKVDKNGELVTTKKCSDLHGYGIKSIKKALENVGDFVYHEEGEKFCATVILY